MTSDPLPGARKFSLKPRGNGPALASLVCALFGFCVPFVGGLLAIIFGVIGLRRSRETASGARLALVGMAIGIISVLGGVWPAMRS